MMKIQIIATYPRSLSLVQIKMFLWFSIQIRDHKPSVVLMPGIKHQLQWVETRVLTTEPPRQLWRCSWLGERHVMFLTFGTNMLQWTIHVSGAAEGAVAHAQCISQVLHTTWQMDGHVYKVTVKT